MPKISVGGTLKPLLFSGIEKVWIREGGISRIFVRIFFLTVPKISVGGEPFSLHYFWESKKFGFERGEYQDFPSKFFVSQCREFSREPFTVALVSGIEKV